MPTNQPDLGGVVVATALAFAPDPSAPAGLAVDYDRYAAHCRYLLSQGCRGIGANGSLGEYSSLTDDERRRVVQTAVAAVKGDGIVIAGAHGVGWHQSKYWAELAKEDGADAVLLLPPTIYRANRRDVVEHYTRVNEVGIPIMIYNNPFDTKVDIIPEVIAELSQLEHVVAVKEFSTDIRRVTEIRERCDIQVICGADDLLLESALMGTTGWFAGFPNAFPRESVEILEHLAAGRIAEAHALYEAMIAVFRWDSKVEFVQAIKLSMDVAGQSYGGPTRPPRGALTEVERDQVIRETKAALAFAAKHRG